MSGHSFEGEMQVMRILEIDSLNNSSLLIMLDNIVAIRLDDTRIIIDANCDRNYFIHLKSVEEAKQKFEEVKRRIADL
jgi:hypothetical protein